MIRLIVSFAFLTVFSAFSQIEFSSFEKQTKANLEQLPDAESITAKSSCGEVSVKMTDKTFSGGCAGTLVREYVATDDCGNTASAMQFISLEDTTPPLFESSNPTEIGKTQMNAQPEVSDNSGLKVKLSFEDQKAGDRITRTWKAVDTCGNVSEFIQTVRLSGEL